MNRPDVQQKLKDWVRPTHSEETKSRIRASVRAYHLLKERHAELGLPPPPARAAGARGRRAGAGPGEEEEGEEEERGDEDIERALEGELLYTAAEDLAAERGDEDNDEAPPPRLRRRGADTAAAEGPVGTSGAGEGADGHAPSAAAVASPALKRRRRKLAATAGDAVPADALWAGGGSSGGGRLLRPPLGPGAAGAGEGVDYPLSAPGPAVGSSRFFKSEEHRARIAASIKARWQDPTYRERVQSGMRKTLAESGASSRRAPGSVEAAGGLGVGALGGTNARARARAAAAEKALQAFRRREFAVRLHDSHTRRRQLEAHARRLVEQAEAAAGSLQAAGVATPAQRLTLQAALRAVEHARAQLAQMSCEVEAYERANASMLAAAEQVLGEKPGARREPAAPTLVQVWRRGRLVTELREGMMDEA